MKRLTGRTNDDDGAVFKSSVCTSFFSILKFSLSTSPLLSSVDEQGNHPSSSCHRQPPAAILSRIGRTRCWCSHSNDDEERGWWLAASSKPTAATTAKQQQQPTSVYFRSFYNSHLRIYISLYVNTKSFFLTRKWNRKRIGIKSLLVKYWRDFGVNFIVLIAFQLKFGNFKIHWNNNNTFVNSIKVLVDFRSF